MTTAPNFLPGTPIWMELFTSNVDRSIDFYTQLMGWAFTEPQEEAGGYRNIVFGENNVAGCMVNDQPSSPDCWWVYLHSPQVDSVQTEAEAAGGQLLVPVMDVMDLGRAVVVADPSGVPVGGWQPGQHPGFSALNIVGTPAWFELHTNTFDATVGFLNQTFDIELESMADNDDFRYSTIRNDDSGFGVMDISVLQVPFETRPGWRVYFEVADVHAATAQAERLGATILQPPEESPYGTFTQLLDPVGVAVNLVTSSNDES